MDITRRQRKFDLALVFVVAALLGATGAHALAPADDRGTPVPTRVAHVPDPPRAVVFAPLSASPSRLRKALEHGSIAGFTGRWDEAARGPNAADARELAALRRESAASFSALLKLSSVSQLNGGVNCESPRSEAQAAGTAIGRQARTAGYDLVLGPAVNGCKDIPATPGVIAAFVRGLDVAGVAAVFRGYNASEPSPTQDELARLSVVAVAQSRYAVAPYSRALLPGKGVSTVLMVDHDASAGPSIDVVPAARGGADGQLYEADTSGWETANAEIENALGRDRFNTAVSRLRKLPRTPARSGAP